MSRPTPPTISSTLEAWDADIQAGLDMIFGAPVPLYEHDDTLADLETNFPAANYDRCVCLVNDTTLGWIMAYSNGSAWIFIPLQGVDPSDISGSSGGSGTAVVTITDPADTPATADALRDDLVTNSLPEIRNCITGLQAKVNGILAAMRAAGQM
jgi:hypothetical protein